MTINRSLLAAWAFVLAAVAVGVLAYFSLPAHAVIPAHFTTDGRIDSYMPKGRGLAILPAITVLVVGLLSLLPRVSPQGGGLQRSPAVYGLTVVGVAAVLFTSEAAIAAKALNPSFDLLRAVFLAVAVLLVVLGNALGKLRQNDVIGIKTPWTRGDERVWDKTHRFTGWTMVIAGFALAAIDLVGAPGPWLIAMTVLCAAGPLVVGAAYSRRLARAR